MERLFEKYSFEKGKIKTTSIVSYGVRNVIKFQGDDTLFVVWSNPDKEKAKRSDVAADSYVKYCGTQINYLLSALKVNLPDEKWT